MRSGAILTSPRLKLKDGDSQPSRAKVPVSLTVAFPCYARDGLTPSPQAERASPAACGTFAAFTVRFSIGFEDAEDLISDAYVALDSLGRP